MTLAASASTAEAGLSVGQSAAAVVVFVVIASISAAGPVLFFLLAPRAAARPLEAIEQFMSEHSAVIVFVVLLIRGAKLLGDGMRGLAS